jgi:hypothetical protein
MKKDYKVEFWNYHDILIKTKNACESENFSLNTYLNNKPRFYRMVTEIWKRISLEGCKISLHSRGKKKKLDESEIILI